MIQPNRLSNPGENAALARVEAVAERIDQLPVDRLVPSRHALIDPAERARLLDELDAEADRCGRRALLDDVRDRVEANLISRFTPLIYRGEIAYPVPTHASARPEDEAVIVTALLDAVAVAFMEDRLEPRTAARLAAPGYALLGGPGPGHDAAPPAADAIGVPEPTPQDWADAARGATRVTDEWPARSSGRVGLGLVVAGTLAPAAVLFGVLAGEPLVGALGGVAVLAVAWLIATYRR